MAKPNLAYIPATIGGKVYSILPSDGVGDFDFTRGTVATRINAQGLIEEVASGENRLNYSLLDGEVVGCPHLLLEPQRTNLIPYSESLSNWTSTNISALDNQAISPDGTLNASKVFANVGTGAKSFYQLLSVTSSKPYVFSVFLKKSEYKNAMLRIGGQSGSPYVIYDLDTQSVVSESGVSSTKIESYNNDWYRVSAIITTSGTVYAPNIFFLPDNNYTIGSQNIPEFNGDGVSGGFAWGAMLEQGSYPTSYIKTTSAAVTRAAETCNNSGDAATFNDSEGVLMAESSFIANDGTLKYITLNSGSTANRIILASTTTSNQIRCQLISSSLPQVELFHTLQDIKSNIKIAFKYKENDFAFWVNGFKVGTYNNGSVSIGLNSLDFSNVGGTQPFYGNTKQIQYFDTTDIDLEQLTSWDSFRAMAEGQLYTIE